MSSNSSDRRGFLRRVSAAVGGVFAAVFGVPAAATALHPALKSAADDWKEVGDAAAVKPGVATRVTYDVRSGFEARKKSAFLVRDGDAIVALDSRCTHFGCTVRFRDGKLLCPCHGGVFSLEGAPIDGPPDEPLRRLETKVENGKVKVKA